MQKTKAFNTLVIILNLNYIPLIKNSGTKIEI